jgi:uncharacterized protein YuzE
MVLADLYILKDKELEEGLMTLLGLNIYSSAVYSEGMYIYTCSPIGGHNRPATQVCVTDSSVYAAYIDYNDEGKIIGLEIVL